MATEPMNAEPSGVLCVDKPQGMTSHDVVNRIRRLYGTKRVGHTGTLDPLATGLLTVLVGRAAKAAEYLAADRKEYVATLQLGLTTDTEDITGQVLTRSTELPKENAVHTCAKGFVGKQGQIPPMYSAIKIGGKKLMDLARQQITVERAPREIEIHRLDVETVNESEGLYRLTVGCSKGTYIRSLCRDIGEALGCGGTMRALRRLQSGNFSLENAVTLEELETMTSEERKGKLLPVASLFEDCPALPLPAFFERLARRGNEIYLRKIKSPCPLSEGDRVRLLSQTGRFFALAEIRAFEDGLAAKPLKQFELEDASPQRFQLILASASPRRREMLQNLGADFRILPTAADESHGELPPTVLVTTLAARKAAAAAKALTETECAQSLVIACDTVVDLDGNVLEKPHSAEEAFAMLSALSGRTHLVHSGLCLRCGAKEVTECVSTAVTFRPLTEGEIRAYIAGGEPFDKAGGYGIQGTASAFVSKVEGDYQTVVGMPLCRLTQLLREEFSYDLLQNLGKKNKEAKQ